MLLRPTVLSEPEHLLALLMTVTARIVAVHHQYVDHTWGTFRLSGESYRLRADRDWHFSQLALLRLQQQAVRCIPLNRDDVGKVEFCAQGMHQRLYNEYEAREHDLSRIPELPEVHRLWAQIKGIKAILSGEIADR
jgi:hypothetical protein